MKMIWVSIYKNAVKIDVHHTGHPVVEHIIKIRWWQREAALNIIDSFHTNNIMELYNNNIEWRINEDRTLKYDFKANQSE